MKKKKLKPPVSFNFSLQAPASSRKYHRFFELILYTLLLFMCCLGFFLSLCRILSCSFPGKDYLPSLLFCCLLYGLLSALDEHLRKKRHKFPVFIFIPPVFLFFLSYWKKEWFFSGFFHSANEILSVASRYYHLDLPGITLSYVPGEAPLFFILIFTFFYTWLFGLIMLHRVNLGCFFVLLVIPAASCMLIGFNIPVLAAGLFLTAFCGRAALKDTAIVSGCVLIGITGSVFLLCTLFLTPLLSPYLFSKTTSLLSLTNEIGSKAVSFFKEDPAKKTQTLTNESPVFNHSSALKISSSSRPETTLYLRGFVGADYKDNTWRAVSGSGSSDFPFTQTQLQTLADLPYQCGSRYTQEKKTEIEITRQKADSTYAYLPYGFHISHGFPLKNDGAILSTGTNPVSGHYFPYTQEIQEKLYSNALYPSKDMTAFLNSYDRYVSDTYLTYPSHEFPKLSLEISAQDWFPSSNTEEYTWEEIMYLRDSIISYLHSQASYSLLLNTENTPAHFLDSFLYEEKKGYCIHFASAATLIFRMVHIPARYVTGYIVPADSFTPSVNGTYTADIADSLAHAWTEIYVGNGTWIPVDATPSYGDSQIPSVSETVSHTVSPVPGEETEQMKESPEISQTLPSPSLQPSSSPNRADSTSVEHKNKTSADQIAEEAKLAFDVLKYSTTAILIVFLCGFLLILRRSFLLRKRMGFIETSTQKAYTCIYQSLITLMKLAGYDPGSSSNDREYISALCKSLPEPLQEEFWNLSLTMEKLTFSDYVPNKQDLRQARYYYRKCKRYYLKKISFLKKCYYLFIRVI